MSPVRARIAAMTSRHYYWRQLRDMKGPVEAMAPVALNFCAGICGWTWPGPTPGRAIRWRVG
jgi:hypothetical protein